MAVIAMEHITKFLRMHKQAIQAYNRHIEETAHRLGLAKPEADVLLFLANNPQHNTARDVVQYRGFSKTYVSRSVESLVRQGLLTTVQSAADRRVQYLHLTERASLPVRLLRQSQKEFFHFLTEDLSDQEVAMLERVFQQVDHKLSLLK